MRGLEGRFWSDGDGTFRPEVAYAAGVTPSAVLMRMNT